MQIRQNAKKKKKKEQKTSWKELFSFVIIYGKQK